METTDNKPDAPERKPAEAHAAMFAILKGPNDTTGDGEYECRLCREFMVIEPGHEPSALCHACAQEAAQLLAPEVEALRERWSTTLDAAALRQLFTAPHALGDEERGPWIRLHASAYELAPRLLAALDKLVDGGPAPAELDALLFAVKDEPAATECACRPKCLDADPPDRLCGGCLVRRLASAVEALRSALHAAINPVAHRRVHEALIAAEKAQEDVREVLRGRGHERMAPLAREVQTRINQLIEANDGWFKKAGRAEERANRARVVRDKALAAVADKAWPFLRDHILGADGAKNLHDAAERALRGVRVSHRAEVLKRMVAFVAACRTDDEKARAALLEKAGELIEDGREHAERVANAVAEWETTEPGSDARAGAKLSNVASDAVEHIRDLATALEVAATQAHLREKAVEIAVEGFRVQLALMGERLNAANARADAAEAGLAAVRRVVEEHDGEDPIPMVLPTIADEVRARLAAADQKAREAERERDAANAKT